MCEKYQSEYRLKAPLLKEKFPHLFNFDIAKNAKKYKAAGHSIEYIYTDKIQVGNVKEIGNSELNTNTCKNKYNLLKFLRQILANNNEIKALNIYDRIA